MSFAMDNYVSRAATYEELADFHSTDYLDFLGTVLPEPVPRDVENQNPDLKFNLGGSDCPLFEGLYDYCSMSAGSALDAARKICANQSDIAIAWGGGLHHAKKAEASGFCYINDIVIAILELLRHYPRVLYIDIDVHHGDGVEEAFFSTDRVMTVSFHKYDPNNFFPGTGALDDNGPKNEQNPGAHHAVNVPLNDGITDEQYDMLFNTIISRIVEKFRPSAIALQCGADSLAGDRLGRFNLQVQGHGACVEFCKRMNLPSSSSAAAATRLETLPAPGRTRLVSPSAARTRSATCCPSTRRGATSSGRKPSFPRSSRSSASPAEQEPAQAAAGHREPRQRAAALRPGRPQRPDAGHTTGSRGDQAGCGGEDQGRGSRKER